MSTAAYPHGRMRVRVKCVGLVVGAVCLAVLACSSDDRHGRKHAELAKSHVGSSAGLSKTVILPTLDEPLPEGKNAIWCASFQIVWDRLASDVLKAPPQVSGAESLCARLNGTPFDASNLRQDCCYAAAGFVNDGIVEKITGDMRSRFPSVPAPTLTSEQEAIVAYAYLGASLKFTIPFFDSRDALSFQDSASGEAAVASFGIRHDDDYAYYDMREQVDVLYAAFGLEGYEDGYHKAQFAIDPCKDSTPYQIVLAYVPRGDTLGATLSQLEQKINGFAEAPHGDEFGPNDVLLVPMQNWRIEHHFSELEGRDKHLKNPGFEGYYVAQALQTIDFRLDRGGAELKSEAKVFYAPVPRYFIFDRPFLVYMKLRGAERPFFVMWVDNSELLLPFAG